jgi:beta-glucosidase
LSKKKEYDTMDSMKQVRFPKGFIWGTSTSAYQIEGSWNEDGRGPSIWDDFVHKKGNIKNNDTGDIACDHYHGWKEDCSLLSQLGCKAYRFSVSWSRIYPEGSGKLNQKGVDFYSRLIDELLQRSIEPFLTCYHFDLPLSLQNKGGWVNRDTVHYFTDYVAELASLFSDRVRYWITINEPGAAASLGYLMAMHPPGLKDPAAYAKVIHNFLLANGEAWRRIKDIRTDSCVGPAIDFWPIFPASAEDTEAAQNAAMYIFSIIIDPLIQGDYSEVVKKKFICLNNEYKESDMEAITGACDFIGVNNYSRFVVKRHPSGPDYINIITPEYTGFNQTDTGWEVFPESLYQTVMILKNSYGNPPVFITENGASYDYPVKNGKVGDSKRIDYLKGYLDYTARAINNGCDIRGYFYWSLLDNFEWTEGFSQRFGIVHVDFNTQQRIIKESGHWYKKCIEENGFALT